MSDPTDAAQTTPHSPSLDPTLFKSPSGSPEQKKKKKHGKNGYGMPKRRFNQPISVSK